jgi:hypothetical protein
VTRGGIPEWAISVVRWTGAVVALVLLVSFAVPRAWEELQGAVALNTGMDDDELPTADEADTQPAALEEGQLVAQSDLATRNGTVSGRTDQVLTVGSGAAEQILIGFEAVPADTACLTNVTLEALLLDASADTEVHVRPATLIDITALENGQALPVDALIEGGPPAVAVAAAGSSGWLRWSATDAYTLAARSAGPESLVVLSISTPEADEDEAGDATVAFATTDNPDDFSARLSWSAVAGCSDVGTGTAEAPDPLLEQEASGREQEVDPEEPEDPEA